MAKTTERVVLEGPLATRVVVHGEGPPVVYLRSEEGWVHNPFVEALAEGFTVFVPELAGTEVVLDELDGLHDLLIHVNELLDALDLGAVAVVGHSFGGMVAAELAAMNPERVTSLALLAPLGLWNDAEPVADLNALPPEELLSLLFADTASPAADAWRAANGPDRDLALQRMRTMRAAYHFVFPVPELGLARRLRRVAAPTLVVWGEQDGIMSPTYAKELGALLPSARVELVAGAAHMLTNDQPEVVAALVRGHLDG